MRTELPKLRMSIRFPSPVPILACALLAFPVEAADFTGYVVLTTDYVFRGVTYSDGDPAAQLGADLSFDNGFFFGVWGSTIDIESLPFSDRDVELSFYAGYGYDVSSDWTVSGNVVAYRYPGAGGITDYDYEEYMVNVNYKDRVWLEYAYSPDVFDSGESTNNVRLYTEWPWPYQLTGSAGIGYYDISNVSGDDYSYWEFGVTRPLGIIDLDLRYHDSSRWVPVVSNADRADSRVVLSARFQF